MDDCEFKSLWFWFALASVMKFRCFNTQKNYKHLRNYLLVRPLNFWCLSKWNWYIQRTVPSCIQVFLFKWFCCKVFKFQNRESMKLFGVKFCIRILYMTFTHLYSFEIFDTKHLLLLSILFSVSLLFCLFLNLR